MMRFGVAITFVLVDITLQTSVRLAATMACSCSAILTSAPLYLTMCFFHAE